MRSHRFEQAMWGSRYGLLRAGGLCTLYDKNTGEVICELADREAALAILRHLQAGETPIPIQEFAHLRELAWLLLKAKLRAWWRGHQPPYIWAWPRRRSKRFRGVRRR
jgi:hypothetical protein